MGFGSRRRSSLPGVSNTSTQQRRSSLNDLALSSKKTTPQQQRRRASLMATARRNSQTSLQEKVLHMQRCATEEEGPRTSWERKQRRKSRKKDFKEIQDNRSNRMNALIEKRASLRQSFVSEEEELDRLMGKTGDTTGSSRWSACCGIGLCCQWWYYSDLYKNPKGLYLRCFLPLTAEQRKRPVARLVGCIMEIILSRIILLFIIEEWI